MEKNKKKSRALIITFFIMIVLLFLFYILFIKNNPLDTKGTSSENRGFFSLFSKSKNADLENINTEEEGDTTLLETENNISKENINSELIDGQIVDKNNTENQNTDDFVYNTRLRSIPTPEEKEIEGVDIPNTTTTTTFPEPEIQNEKQCNLDDYKLKFTEAEKAELDKLLREFYKIASSVKTEEDIDLEHDAKQSYIDLVNEAKDLTKQCYAETSSPTYLANFDWNNALNDQDNTPSGIWISRNHSRLSESRVERKVNPWYIFSSNTSDSYSYTGQIIERSARFSIYTNDYRVERENYKSTVFRDNVDARNACVAEAQNETNIAQNKLGTNYKVSYKCHVVDGLLSNTPGKSIYNFRSDVWYPDINWSNTSGSDIDPKEYYFSESECKKRAPSCTQIYKNDIPSKTLRLAPIEWIYTIDVTSPSFSTEAICKNTALANGHKNAVCVGSSSTNAYIQKLWNQNLLDDKDSEKNTYISPIDYYLFEQMFNIW